MDPSAIKCSYHNSFSPSETTVKLHTYVSSSSESPRNLIPGSPTTLISPNESEEVEQAKYDPFQNVSTEPFRSRDSITLANLDAIFNFSQHTSGYILQQEDKNFTFVSLHDDGAFTEYILYRNPNAYGYGYPEFRRLPSRRTNFKGDNFNSVLADNAQEFIYFMKSVEVTGTDLVISKKDYLNSLLIALSVIKIGGTFVSSISATGRGSNKEKNLLWITAQCFDKITLFVPIANPNQTYVIAEGAKVNNTDWINYLSNSHNIKSVSLPESFLIWLNYSVDYSNLNIDTYKCRAIWNLP